MLSQGSLHLIGLGPTAAFSHLTHLFALLKWPERGLKKVYVHALLDGRDVPPTSGSGYIKELMEEKQKIGVGEIATVQGRYWGMDRDNIWERVARGYDAMVMGEGEKAEDPYQAVEDSYKQGITDEFMKPTVIVKGGKPVGTINADDSVVFFNSQARPCPPVNPFLHSERFYRF